MKFLTYWSKHTRLNMVLTWLLLGLVLLTDRLTPLGFAHGILYVPLMVGAMFISNTSLNFKRAVLVAGLIGTAVGYVISPGTDGLPTTFIISNRILSAAILLITYIYINQLMLIRQQNTDIHKLQQSQRRTMKEYANALPIQVWTANAQGKLDFVSNHMTDFTGRSRDDILENWLTLLHPEDRDKTANAWQQAVQSREPYNIDFRIQRSDGNYFWFQTQAIPQRDEHGSILRWLGSSMDVDDVRRLTEESEQLADRYRHTVESITDAFFTLDHDFRFSYLNQKAAEILGATIDDLIGHVIWDKCRNGLDCPFAERFRHAALHHEKLYFEDYLRTSDKWLEVNVYPSPTGLTVHFSDITLLRKEREQLNLLSTAVARLNDIIIITEADPLDEPGPKTVFVNPAFENLTGYAMHEILGKNPRILQGPKTNTEELTRIRSALQNQLPIRTELLNYTKAGEEYWLEIEIVPIVDNKGKCTHFVAVERNITERISMENQLRESQKLEVVGQLTGGVAHDFNNLLTVILSNMEMLSEELEDPEHQSMAEMTMTAAKRGAVLTSRLLSFARRQPLAPRATNINELINSMLALYRRTLPENIDLFFSPESDLGTIEVDATELDTAILNLVVNARDAMPKGGTIRIRTSNTVLERDNSGIIPGKYVMVSVSDNGTGMGADIMSKVFEPFFTTKDVGAGSGLGLSMVFGFTKQSGGHIHIESTPGIGTTVKLFFPIVSEIAAPADVPDQSITLDGGTEHILIVEDDLMVLKHLQVQLSSLGYRISTAMSGPEALLALSMNEDIDLLLTDVIMPGGMNGMELVAQSLAEWPQLKVLFTSGYTDQAMPTDRQIESTEELLSKPYTRLELATKVRRVLNRTTLAGHH